MPLTGKAASVMSKFVARYKKRGKSVFYATVNSNPKFAKAMGESSVYDRGHPK